MKVIGKVDRTKYLVEIDHIEIEKFLNLYYKKMEQLQVGDEVDLGKGYDWYQETKKALNTTIDFFKSNAKTIDVITKAFISNID